MASEDFEDVEEAVRHAARCRLFEEQLKAGRLDPAGVSGLKLAVPCRPPDVPMNDLQPNFEGSYEGLLLAEDWTLVHGILRFGAEGDEAHAWLESERLGVVYDVDRDRCYHTEDYYARFPNLVATARYDVDAAGRMLKAHGHCGPWLEDANPYTGEQVALQ